MCYRSIKISRAAAAQCSREGRAGSWNQSGKKMNSSSCFCSSATLEACTEGWEESARINITKWNLRGYKYELIIISCTEQPRKLDSRSAFFLHTLPSLQVWSIDMVLDSVVIFLVKYELQNKIVLYSWPLWNYCWVDPVLLVPQSETIISPFKL